MNAYKFCSTIIFGLALIACGGGGGNAGSASGVGNPSVPVVAVSDFDIAIDKMTLLSTSNEKATLTITAVDANRNVLPGAAVAVTVDSGGIFTPNGAALTSSAGVFSGAVSFGSDTSSRILKVTVAIGTIIKSVSINVTNSLAIKSDYIFELDKTIISNSGNDKAVLTITTLDNARNVVSGIPVLVSLDSNGVFSRTGAASTDANGRFVGNIGIGSDRSNRTITATINVGGVLKTASILVSGSAISATAVPSTPSPGQLVNLNIFVADKSGLGISNTAVSLSGNIGFNGALTTDSVGIATKSFNAPLIPGTYAILVSGAGVDALPVMLQVIDPSGVGVPDAIGTVSAPTLSAIPSQLQANLPGSTTSRSKLSAKFLTSSNVGIKNMRVRFDIVSPSLGGGESVSTSSALVYSDDNGVAIADYIAGTRTSPTNGVVVRACYGYKDFGISECPNSKIVNLTVSGTPLSISIFSDNLIAKGLGNIAYVKQYLIQVNDAAGVAVKDAVVAVSVDITHYGKATSWNPSGFKTPTLNLLNPGLNVSTVNTTLGFLQNADTIVPTVGTPADPTATPPTLASAGIQVFCANEDKSRNGFLDVGEDRNGNGILDSRKADIIVSYLNGNKTDENGQLLVQATWGQNVGGWLYFTLRATVGVDGSEGDVSKPFMTTVDVNDVPNGTFLSPPYGRGSCSQPN